MKKARWSRQSQVSGISGNHKHRLKHRQSMLAHYGRTSGIKDVTSEALDQKADPGGHQQQVECDFELVCGNLSV